MKRTVQTNISRHIWTTARGTSCSPFSLVRVEITVHSRTISFSTFLSQSRAIIGPSRTFLYLLIGLQIWSKWKKSVSICYGKLTEFLPENRVCLASQYVMIQSF